VQKWIIKLELKTLNKTTIFILMLSLIFVYGCATFSELTGFAASEITFKQGIKKINELDEKYEVDLKTAPSAMDDVEELLTQFIGFKAVNELPEPLEYLLDFKIKFLEAEKLNLEGWQWGKGSTTDYGFGCRKGYARVKEAAKLRNQSAQKGYEAVDALQKFVDQYPKQAKSLDLGQKDVLVLNALYFQIEEKAIKDDKIIESACGGKGYNATLSE
tara:strand:- start:692 stop:1339 length:648 start_codon:yes stop_codon:yes gene_type:complete